MSKMKVCLAMVPFLLILSGQPSFAANTSDRSYEAIKKFCKKHSLQLSATGASFGKGQKKYRAMELYSSDGEPRRAVIALGNRVLGIARKLQLDDRTRHDPMRTQIEPGEKEQFIIIRAWSDFGLGNPLAFEGRNIKILATSSPGPYLKSVIIRHTNKNRALDASSKLRVTFADDDQGWNIFSSKIKK